MQHIYLDVEGLGGHISETFYISSHWYIWLRYVVLGKACDPGYSNRLAY